MKGGHSSIQHLLSQSEADELVPAGLQEVLDVFLPAKTQVKIPNRILLHLGGGSVTISKT